MIRNTPKRGKKLASRLTHIMQIQTQYARLWLRSRLRRMTVPDSFKIAILTFLAAVTLILTGTLLLVLDVVMLLSKMIKRPFRRGSYPRRSLVRSRL